MTREEKFYKYQYLVHGAINKYFGDEYTVNQNFSYYGLSYDDLAQIGFMYLWRVLDKLNNENKPSTYIYRGVRYAVINYLRKEGAFIKMLPMDRKYDRYWNSYNKRTPDGESELIDFIPSEKENEFEKVDNQVFFEQLSQRMKGEDRELILYLLQGKQQKEFAQIKGVSRQSVTQRFQKIVKNVKNEMEKSEVKA